MGKRTYRFCPRETSYGHGGGGRGRLSDVLDENRILQLPERL